MSFAFYSTHHSKCLKKLIYIFLPSQSENTYLNQCLIITKLFVFILSLSVSKEPCACREFGFQWAHAFSKHLMKMKHTVREKLSTWWLGDGEIFGVPKNPKAVRASREHQVPARAAQIGGGAGKVLETIFGCQPGGSNLMPFLHPACVAASHKLMLWW